MQRQAIGFALAGIMIGAGLGAVLLAPEAVKDLGSRLTGAIASDSYTAVRGFQVALAFPGGVNPQTVGGLQSVSGCAHVLGLSASTVGEEKYSTPTVGYQEIDECTITGRLPLAGPLALWYNDQTAGKEWRRDVHFAATDGTGKALRTWAYRDAFVTKLDLPDFDGSSESQAWVAVTFRATSFEAGAPMPAASTKYTTYRVLESGFGTDLTIEAVEIAGLDVTIPTREVTDSADAKWRAIAPGQPDFPTIKVRVTDNAYSQMQAWMSAAGSGQNPRKDITINVRSDTGVQVGSILLASSIPVSLESHFWDANDGGSILYHTISIRVGMVRMA